MSLSVRHSGAIREVYNPQIRTGGVHRVQRGMWARTSAIWRNFRPTTSQTITFASSEQEKLTIFGYSNGTVASGTSTNTPAAFGSRGTPNRFGDALLIRVTHFSGSYTIRLGTASLGATFLTTCTMGGAGSGTSTYTTGTGFSSWFFSSATQPMSGTSTLRMRGPG